ncbi:hypothetical protein ACQ5SK_27065 [Bradyrhizobium japonicum]
MKKFGKTGTRSFFCGGDIANILVDNGFNTPALVADFLSKEYPLRASET